MKDVESKFESEHGTEGHVCFTTSCPPNKPSMQTSSQDATVVLPVYDWHLILKDLESLFSIINRDNKNTIRIYEVISSQLSDTPVEVHQGE